MRKTIINWLLAGSICCLAGAPALAQIHVDYMSPPASVAKLFEKADVVVRARIVGRTATKNGFFRPVTDYSVVVIEKFKGDGSIPDRGAGLTVRRTGGLTPPDAEVGFPLFHAGEEYVFFLEFRRDMQGWTPAYGPDGVIGIDAHGVVRPVGSSVQEISARYKDQKSAEFLDVLRRLGS